ncbi:hypothetical protein SAMN05216359_101381 [Roseateles sp. YR242]|nr:hypothetical protein SAMN05216359_101381 [Roseateles sp. YR242]
MGRIMKVRVVKLCSSGDAVRCGAEKRKPSDTQQRPPTSQHDTVAAFFNEVLAQAEQKNWLSNEHFSVDGTLIQAWASHKSFVRKDKQGKDRANASSKASGGRNPVQGVSRGSISAAC